MWLLFSFLTAFFYAAGGAWSKKVTRTVNNYTATWAMFTFGIPFLVIPLAISGLPEIKTPFIWGWGGSLLINMLAFTLFVKALKISPLSLTFPFLSFTPIFLIFTGYIFLGELPDIYGVFGIILVASGAYVLNMCKESRGILAPLRAIKNEKGSVFMLIVSLLWSFAASLDKVALLSSSPYFYIVAFHTGFFVLYLPFLIKLNPGFPGEVKRNYPSLFVLGILEGLMAVFQMTALRVALVSYVISIKRSGMILSLVMGALFFKEEINVYRAAGTVIMVLGVVLISF
jgi:uncharacterized membrane protein